MVIPLFLTQWHPCLHVWSHLSSRLLCVLFLYPLIYGYIILKPIVAAGIVMKTGLQRKLIDSWVHHINCAHHELKCGNSGSGIKITQPRGEVTLPFDLALGQISFRVRALLSYVICFSCLLPLFIRPCGWANYITFWPRIQVNGWLSGPIVPLHSARSPRSHMCENEKSVIYVYTYTHISILISYY